MLITIDDVLSPQELDTARALLAQSSWASGLITAGSQAAQAKNNLQLAEGAEHLEPLRRLVLGALGRNAVFFMAARPSKILPPFFNCYGGETNHYGYHVDSAIRSMPDGSGLVRTDVSATLFLSEPEEYDGGVLTIEDTFGSHGVKLKAGGMVVYPSSSVHQVSPVTRGRRMGCFMFIQSMVRDDEQRRMLFDMEVALLQLRQSAGENDAVARLSSVYQNLLRRWAEN